MGAWGGVGMQGAWLEAPPLLKEAVQAGRHVAVPVPGGLSCGFPFRESVVVVGATGRGCACLLFGQL